MSDADLQQWECKFGIAMPEDLLMVLRDSDGPIMFEQSTGKELQFLAASDGVGCFDAYGFEEFCPEAIPVAMDGSSNFVVFRNFNASVDGLFAMAAGNLGWEDAVKVCTSIPELIALNSTIDELLHYSEQPGTGQPATRPVDKPEGGDKPQPEAEGRCP